MSTDSATSNRCSADAVDDLGRVGVRSGQFETVAALGMIECVVAAGSQGDGVGGEAARGSDWGSAVITPGDQKTAQRGEQQGAPGRLGLQAPPPSALGRRRAVGSEVSRVPPTSAPL